MCPSTNNCRQTERRLNNTILSFAFVVVPVVEADLVVVCDINSCWDVGVVLLVLEDFIEVDCV